MKRRAGFSLLEVLVAGAILATIGMAVMSALTQSAREVTAASDFTIALLLEEKVSEETMYGLDVDSHGDDRLVEMTGPLRSIQEPTTPYFSVIEDTAAPWGRLEPGIDLHIQESDPELFRLYRGFNHGMEVVPKPVAELPGQPSCVLEFTSSFECPAYADRTRLFVTTSLIARPVISPQSKPWVAQDDARLEAEIVRQIWPSRIGQPFTAVVNSVGGDLAAARDLGSVLTATEYALLAMAVLDKQIKEFETKAAAAAAGSAELTTNLLGSAKLLELKAALAWKVLLFAKDPARRLSTSLSPQMLGSPATLATSGVQVPMRNVLGFNSVFRVSVARALEAYFAARKSLPPNYPRAFRQYTLERKILELAELRVLQLGTNDVAFIKAWLDYMIDANQARNRWAASFAVEERARATGPAGIAQLQPGISERIADAAAADTALHQMATRIGGI